MTSRSEGRLLIKQAWIPKRLPSNNEVIRMRNWHQRNRIAKEWHQEVEPATPGKRQQPGTQRLLRIVRVIGKRGRIRDDDNLAGGAKFLVDGIVRAGWLIDDAPKYVTISYEQEPGPNEGVLWHLYEPART